MEATNISLNLAVAYLFLESNLAKGLQEGDLFFSRFDFEAINIIVGPSRIRVKLGLGLYK